MDGEDSPRELHIPPAFHKSIPVTLRYILQTFTRDDFKGPFQGNDFENNLLVPYLISFLEKNSAQEIMVMIYNIYITLPKEKKKNADDFFEVLLKYCFRWYFSESKQLQHATEIFIKKKVSTESQVRLQKLWKKKMAETTPYKQPLDATHMSDNYVFLEWNPITLAQQFTLRTAYELWQLHPNEFFNQAWQKKNREELAPIISGMTDLWNDISAWVATSIVLAWPGIKVTKVLIFFINLAVALEELRNFYCLTAVLSGLGNTSVGRLKVFWQQVPRHLLDAFSKLSPLQEPAMSFKAYREKLKTVKATGTAYIPSLVVHLSDITFINLGNPEVLEDGSLNLRRMRYLGTSIAQILGFQFSPPFPFKKVDDVQAYLSNIGKIAVDEKELYQVSRSIKQIDNKLTVMKLIHRHKTERKIKVKRHSAIEKAQLSMEEELEAEKLNITYITEKIIAMGYPLRPKKPNIKSFLNRVHDGKYKVYNLCEEKELRYLATEFHTVAEYPIVDNGVPSLSLIQKFCQDMHSWLAADPDHVVAVHCKDGKGRTGLMIACSLLYEGRCYSAVKALHKFDWRRTSDGKGVTLPSQRRYVHYWEKVVMAERDTPTPTGGLPETGRYLLSNIVLKNHPFGQNPASATVHITDIIYGQGVSIHGEFYNDTIVYKVHGVVVDGDTVLSFGQKELSFSYTFHPAFLEMTSGTGSGANYTYKIHKSDLDGPHADMRNKRYPPDFSIELTVSPFGRPPQMANKKEEPAGEVEMRDALLLFDETNREESFLSAVLENKEEDELDLPAEDTSNTNTNTKGKSSHWHYEGVSKQAKNTHITSGLYRNENREVTLIVKKLCARCKKVIQNGPRTIDRISFWHDECFKCAVCSNLIGDKDVASVSGQLVCVLCIAVADDDGDDDEEDTDRLSATTPITAPSSTPSTLPDVPSESPPPSDLLDLPTRQPRKLSSAKLVRKAMLSQKIVKRPIQDPLIRKAEKSEEEDPSWPVGTVTNIEDMLRDLQEDINDLLGPCTAVTANTAVINSVSESTTTNTTIDEVTTVVHTDIPNTDNTIINSTYNTDITSTDNTDVPNIEDAITDFIGTDLVKNNSQTSTEVTHTTVTTTDSITNTDMSNTDMTHTVNFTKTISDNVTFENDTNVTDTPVSETTTIKETTEVTFTTDSVPNLVVTDTTTTDALIDALVNNIVYSRTISNPVDEDPIGTNVNDIINPITSDTVITNTSSDKDFSDYVNTTIPDPVSVPTSYGTFVDNTDTTVVVNTTVTNTVDAKMDVANASTSHTAMVDVVVPNTTPDVAVIDTDTTNTVVNYTTFVGIDVMNNVVADPTIVSAVIADTSLAGTVVADATVLPPFPSITDTPPNTPHNTTVLPSDDTLSNTPFNDNTLLSTSNNPNNDDPNNSSNDKTLSTSNPPKGNHPKFQRNTTVAEFVPRGPIKDLRKGGEEGAKGWSFIPRTLTRGKLITRPNRGLTGSLSSLALPDPLSPKKPSEKVEGPETDTKQEPVPRSVQEHWMKPKRGGNNTALKLSKTETSPFDSTFRDSYIEIEPDSESEEGEDNINHTGDADKRLKKVRRARKPTEGFWDTKNKNQT